MIFGDRMICERRRKALLAAFQSLRIKRGIDLLSVTPITLVATVPKQASSGSNVPRCRNLWSPVVNIGTCHAKLEGYLRTSVLLCSADSSDIERPSPARHRRVRNRRGSQWTRGCCTAVCRRYTRSENSSAGRAQTPRLPTCSPTVAGSTQADIGPVIGAGLIGLRCLSKPQTELNV
jgi:hypothetical protein